ncbi:MAG: hypothetical protein U1E23_00680 [Reyranellaceae bacterium]
MNALAPPSMAAALIAALLVLLQGCSGIPQDGTYQPNKGRGGGWENFRAEAPRDAVTRPS